MWDYEGDEMMFVAASGEMERFLSDRSPTHKNVRALLSPRNTPLLSDLKKPLMAGMRVAFVETTNSLLVYPTAPGAGVAGTVVRVRTSSGDGTVHGGMAHVRWDTGKFQSVFLEHLTFAPKSARAAQIRVASRVGNVLDIPKFFRVAANGDLIQKSSQDLWSLRETGGSYVIERLFDVSGGPLKEGAR